jgi:O-antigen ligase
MLVKILKWLCNHELLFLLLIAPLFLFQGPWTVGAAAVVVLLWVVRFLVSGRLTVPTPMDGALILLYATSLVGLLVSPAPAQSVPRFWTTFYHLALFYGMVVGLRSWRACRVAGDLLVAAGLGVAILAFLGTDWLSPRMVSLPVYEYFPALVRDPSDSNLFNPRVMAMALSVLVPVPLSLALFGDSKGRRLVATGIALVMVVVLVLSQAVQALAGLVVALLVLAVWRSRWFLLAIPVGLALAGAAVLAYGPQKLAVLLLSVENPLGVGVVLRLDIWSRAWALIRDMPYTGIGLDAFPFVQSSFYTGFIIGPEAHAHNLFMQTVLDLGVPGLFGLLWLLFAFGWLVIRGGRQIADRRARALLIGSSAGVAAFLGNGLVDAPWSTKPGVLVWIVLGFGVSIARLAAGSPARVDRRWHIIPSLGLAAILILGVLILPGLTVRNLGSVVAHKALASAQAGGQVDTAQMAQAVGLLERGLQWKPDHSQSYRTLGRLHSWLGNQEQAIQALERSVDLDSKRPMARYGPWVLWLRALTGAEPVDPWDDLLLIYRYWNARYPDRAEGYVLRALVWDRHKGDSARARQMLVSGLEEGAEPEALLRYCLSQSD